MDCKKLSTLVCLLLAISCSKSPSRTAKAVPTGKMRVSVTIVITGIAHLIDDGNNKLVIFPNGTAYNPQHQLLLLASKRYSPTGLSLVPRDQVVGATVVDSFYYKALSPGIEIDLAKSGFDPLIDPTITADATGDSTHEVCPSQQLAPRTSLHWLPKLGDVSHGSGLVIDPDQIKPSPDPIVVSARMSIAGGSLIALLPTAADTFTFTTTAGNDPVQAVSAGLSYTYFADVDATNPTAEIWAAAYGKPSAKIASANVSKAAKSVTFILANVPPDEFFAPTPKKTIEHFEHYYEIYKSGSFLKATPTRGLPKDSCGSGMGGTVECGPARP
ncbi:MAG TPA: hypothetical protein VLC46_01725 [Thermoanaerobaculia bacterium]|jgi:hypothetical protein|nr:hypothetical protein [Thermoanaerobaculia bacterium]